MQGKLILICRSGIIMKRLCQDSTKLGSKVFRWLSCVMLFVLSLSGVAEEALHTRLALDHGRWLINGRPTNPGSLAEGLLMNVRMVNAVFEDRAIHPEFDPEANTARFIAVIPDYAAYGVNAFTIEIANEYPHQGFVHDLLRNPKTQAGLIRLARQTAPGLLISASGYGDGRIDQEVAQAADFLLPHWNGTKVAIFRSH